MNERHTSAANGTKLQERMRIVCMLAVSGDAGYDPCLAVRFVSHSRTMWTTGGPCSTHALLDSQE